MDKTLLDNIKEQLKEFEIKNENHLKLVKLYLDKEHINIKIKPIDIVIHNKVLVDIYGRLKRDGIDTYTSEYLTYCYFIYFATLYNKTMSECNLLNYNDFMKKNIFKKISFKNSKSRKLYDLNVSKYVDLSNRLYDYYYNFDIYNKDNVIDFIKFMGNAFIDDSDAYLESIESFIDIYTNMGKMDVVDTLKSFIKEKHVKTRS